MPCSPTLQFLPSPLRAFRRIPFAAVLAMALLGCASDDDSDLDEDALSESTASEEALTLRRYDQIVVSTVRDKRGGEERLCGEVRNTSPHFANLSVNTAFTASVGVSGGFNLNILKDWVGATFGVNATAGVVFSNAISVGPIRPGASATVYCYAVGDYVTGKQTFDRLWQPPASRKFTVFVPKAVGYRVSYGGS